MSKAAVPGSPKAKGVVIPHHWSNLVRYILWEINRGNQVQILVTGRSAKRGRGKTHFGVALARFIHSFVLCPHCGALWVYEDSERCRWCERSVSSWNPMPEFTYENNTVVGDIDQYKRNCISTNKQVHLFDEAQEASDKYRSMSEDNKKFRDALQILRQWNNIMIFTLPSAEIMQGEIQNLLDVWINAYRRGDGHAYHLWVNDFPPYVRRRIRMDFDLGIRYNEVVHWRDMSDDSIIQELKERKEQLALDSIGEVSEEFKDAFEERKKEWKVETMERLLEYTEMTQNTLSVDIMDMSRNWGSDCNHGRLPQQDSDSEKYPIRS